MSSFYNKSSPYYYTDMSNGYLDIASIKAIPAQADDILYEITSNYENRPDLLAFDLYGDVNLWWVFAARNKSVIKDPTFDLASGVKIYLPKLTTLKSSLGI